MRKVQQPAFSQYHPNGPCRSCFLCGKSSNYYTHFESWSIEEKNFITQHLGSTPPPSSCICQAHQKEAKRNHSKVDYTPKWKKLTGEVKEKSDKKVTYCIHPQCSAASTEVKLITPSFEAIDNLEAALHVKSSPEHPLVLCSKHYHEVYRQFKARPCAGCGVKPKVGTYFTRHSPDASTVSRVLHENMGFDGIVLSTDYICSTCYKVHIAIIQSIESETSSPDEMLKDHIAIWEYKFSTKDTDKLTMAILQSVLFVASEILHNRAVLLPHVASVFLEAYGCTSAIISQQPVRLEVGKGSIDFSTRWLLNQLIV